ncbi:MAG: hypothetical protein M1821_000069 [Bathelium mastoideum]|nr:MAG: hypothetical protein M1821_000069 [Bathelium mastoideum]
MKRQSFSDMLFYALALRAVSSEASPAFDGKHRTQHGWPHHWHGNSSDSAAASTETLVTTTYAGVLTTTSVVTSTTRTGTSAAATVSSTGEFLSSTASPLPFKAGLSGFVGVTSKSAFNDLKPYISWYSDYTPTTSDTDGVKGIPMLWGDGVSCGSSSGDAERMAAFDNLTTNPDFMFGFYEPDCNCPASSNMSSADGTSVWNQKLAPLASKGTLLGSPSMCKQYSENWLTPFSVDATTGKSLLLAEWQYTSIHINKNNVQGVMKDVGYYWTKYQKPVWVSEFACVDDVNEFVPCTNQTEIDQFISNAVDFFASNASVIAFGPSNGEGLGTVWPLIDSSTGKLTATGIAYLNKLKSL